MYGLLNLQEFKRNAACHGFEMATKKFECNMMLCTCKRQGLQWRSLICMSINKCPILCTGTSLMEQIELYKLSQTNNKHS